MSTPATDRFCRKCELYERRLVKVITLVSTALVLAAVSVVGVLHLIEIARTKAPAASHHAATPTPTPTGSSVPASASIPTAAPVPTLPPAKPTTPTP
ncbi:MAG: hypothetical protein RLZZ15_1569 [Verrucomicrobiota bacterium]|jgi:hypothetical protein